MIWLLASTAAQAATAIVPGPPQADGTSGRERATEDVVVLLRDEHTETPAAARSGAPIPGQRIAAGQQPVLRDLRRSGAPRIRPFQLVNALAARVSPAERSRLGSSREVLAVLPDAPVRIQSLGRHHGGPAGPPVPGPAARSGRACPATPDTPLLEPEGLELTHTESSGGLPSAHDSADGAGVRIGILGGAIDVNASELRRGAGSVVAGYEDFTGEGIARPSPILESFGDASVIAAQGAEVYDVGTYVHPTHPLPSGCTMRIRGVAPGATLHVAKVFSDVAAPTSIILQGIEWAVLHEHVDVLNESLVTFGFPDTARNALRMFNAAAVAAGVTVVAAAGDAGPSNTIGSPATEPGVVAVGASTSLRSYAQIGFGGYPAGGRGWLSDNISALSSAGTSQLELRTVDMVAPGDSAWAACSRDTKTYPSCISFFNGSPSPYFLFSGTSEAAPFVSGAAALVVQAYRRTHGGASPTPQLVKTILMSSSTDLHAPAGEQGAGLLNSLRAVELAESAPPSAPAPYGGDSRGAAGPAHIDQSQGAGPGPVGDSQRPGPGSVGDSQGAGPSTADHRQTGTAPPPVPAARASRRPAPHTRGPVLLAAPPAGNVVGEAGTATSVDVTLANTGDDALTVRARVRALAPPTVIARGSTELDPGSALAFTDVDGTPAFGEIIAFSVPPGADRLDGAVAWPAPAPDQPNQPGAGAPVGLTVFDPAGRLAGYSLPLGNGGHGHVGVAAPQPGGWTAVVWSTGQQADPHSIPVAYELTTASFREVRAGRTRIASGGTATMHLDLQVPDEPGDATASVVLSVGGEPVTTAPVAIRSLVPLGPAGGRFSGTFRGSNGLLVGRGVGGEFHAYQFDLPAGRRDVGVSVSASNAGSEVWALLVDPSGMPVTARSTRSFAGPAVSPKSRALQTWEANPSPGRWTVVVILTGPSSSGDLEQRFTGEVTLDTVRATASGLPTHTDTLEHGRPRTLTITVTNTGAAPASYFVDARLNQAGAASLLSTGPSTYSTPDTPLDGYPQFLVPPHTTELKVVARSTTPLAVDIQPYWGAAFYVGDPDIVGSPGTEAVATVAGPVIAPTTWVCDANPLGPFPPQGAHSEVACSATARTNAFDPGVTSSTGNFWLSTTTRDAPPYHPLLLEPGQTGTITVTLTPTGPTGTTVSGFLALSSWDPTTHFGAELATLPYTYTIS